MDTLFADVSEFQRPVNDRYTDAGYRWLSIRSNDGTYEDHNFEENYAWCCRAADEGRITGFMVYFYWRPNWNDTVRTHIRKVQDAGGPHPKMVSMIDVESGGNPRGDQSDGINRCYWALADWLGDKRRVIGYANTPDLNEMWNDRPEGLQLIAAGYGSLPNLPGQFAHQYTDGQGYGGGLPEGAPPFGNCDMNAANGFSPEELAAHLGVGDVPQEDDMAGFTDEDRAKLNYIYDQLGPKHPDWSADSSLGQNAQGEELTLRDGLAAFIRRFSGK